jgi:flagellar hook-length control protein FliK
MFAHGTRHAPERVESTTLTTHVRDPRWADDLGNRLASMVRTGESSASLQMTPVDLGPLEVNVAVRDNQATVHFGAASAETRALLEASIPRLREMLASQGFQLMDSSVSHGFARQTRHEAAGTPRVDALGESPTVTATRTHITGLLDLYA